MAIIGKNTRIKATSADAPIPFNNEATTANAERTEYTITNKTKRYWDKGTKVTVTIEPAYHEHYYIEHAGGKIVFDKPLPGGSTVNVSGAFVTTSLVAECRECSIAMSNPASDTTVYEIPGRRKQATIPEASGTLTGFYNVNDNLKDFMFEGRPIIIEADFDSLDGAGEIFCCYAILDSNEVRTAIADPVGKTASWQSDGPLRVLAK